MLLPLQRGPRLGFLLDRVFPIEGISLRGPIRGTAKGGKLNQLLIYKDIPNMHNRHLTALRR